MCLFFENKRIDGVSNVRHNRVTIYSEKQHRPDDTFYQRLATKKKLWNQLVEFSTTCLLVGSDCDTELTTNNVQPVSILSAGMTAHMPNGRLGKRFYCDRSNGRLVYFYKKHGNPRYFLMDVECRRSKIIDTTLTIVGDNSKKRIFRCGLFVATSDASVNPTLHVIRVNNERLVFKKRLDSEANVGHATFWDAFTPFTDESLMCLGLLKTGENIVVRDASEYAKHGFEKKYLESDDLVDVFEKCLTFTNVCEIPKEQRRAERDQIDKVTDMLQRECALRHAWDKDCPALKKDVRFPYYSVRPSIVNDLDFLDFQLNFAKKWWSSEDRDEKFTAHSPMGKRACFKTKGVGMEIKKDDRHAENASTTLLSKNIVEPTLDAEYFITKTILSRYTHFNELKYGTNKVVQSSALDYMKQYDLTCENRLRFNDFITMSNSFEIKKHYHGDYRFSLFVPDAPIKHLRGDHFACRVGLEQKDGENLRKRTCCGDYLCSGCFNYWRLASNVSTFLVDGNIIYKKLKKCHQGKYCDMVDENHLTMFNHL